MGTSTGQESTPKCATHATKTFYIPLPKSVLEL